MRQAADLKKKFRQLYGGEASVYRAPGRVNLIGEHTDYNDGFVMPAAIDFSTWVAIAPRDDRRLVIHSENFCESVGFDSDERDPVARRHWSDYARGVAITLERAGYRLRGANLLVRGEVPLGAGLSSSAAIEVATGYALLDSGGVRVDRIELAKLCQRAENEFVGARCGIMDQFISCNGRAGHASLLDCRSLDFRLLPLTPMRMADGGWRVDELADPRALRPTVNPPSPANPQSAIHDPQSKGARLVICNTMVRRELAGSEYNTRRAECEAGMRHLARSLPGARALRDVTMVELEEHGRGLPDAIYRRCRHVISENARVIAAAIALERGDLTAFGRLMAESHRSLCDDYEVNCAELDLMVELAGKVEGVYGARMTGGGFGGCTVNLVRAENIEQFRRAVTQGYEQATGRKPEIYVCSAAEGAEEVF